MEQGIHYRQGGKLQNCGCEMLPDGKDIDPIVIERIELKEKHEIGGRTERNIWLAHFAPNPYTNLPMILNATNRKRIAKLYYKHKVEDGSLCAGRINLLKNVPVRLTMEECRDIQDGGTTYGLRISKIPPKKVEVASTKPKKVVLSQGHPNWLDCIKWLRDGNALESLKTRFDISPEIEELLLETASNG